MGVDLGIHKAAWSLWEDDILQSTEAYASSGHRATELEEIGAKVRVAAELLRPDAIWIEDILIGNNRKYSINLAQTMGAVLASLGAKWADKTLWVNVATWKKEVIGNGHAKKEDIQNYIYTQDSAYSVLCGHDQDRFDAACIGYYGYIISKRAEALRV